jgi:hypothetical protein
MITQRQNTGGLIGGIILIGLGLVFLLGQYTGFGSFAILWPLFIVGMGAVFFVGMLAGGKSMAPLAVPGSILTTIGLLLVFQNLTGHWETWAYAWTAIIMAVGIGIYIMGVRAGFPDQRRAGLRLAGIGLLLLAFFGSFFELVLFSDGSPWRQAVQPVLLILAGLFLVLRRSGLLFGRGGSSPVGLPPTSLSEPDTTRPVQP